jgi:magnesium chelatase subunit D
LDTSASTLSDSLSSIAKSVVMNITDKAYIQRDKISLLGFGNNNVETIIKAGRAPKQVTSLLDNISALGGTPLRLILEKAGQSIKQLSQQYPSVSLFCYLITDGRSRTDIDDLKLNIPTLLIDIENAQIKRGRGRELANQLNAQYFAVSP